ncbi:MAG: hypothetical protein U9R04_01195, partial [Chloroflexota bacterium]|nr:hypothetical protein [Chloroflexota bacterium]
GFEMAPDRFGPKTEARLWEDMGRLWCCVNDENLLEDLIKMVVEPPITPTDESHNIRINMWIGGDPVSGKPYIRFIKENAMTWRKAWSNVLGKNAVIRTDDSYDTMVTHLGYKSVGVQWEAREGLAEAITVDKDLIKASQERLSKVEIIPDTRLAPRQLANLGLARAITAEVSRYDGVAGVYAAIIPPASDRVRTAGMYAKETKTVYISANQLSGARTTVDTLVHELAHHQSQAEDLTEAHSAAMTSVAASVVQATAKGKFDEILKGVSWYG